MNFITIGKIVKPQGIKGEVKVSLYTNYPDAIIKVTNFFVKGKDKQLKAKTVSVRFGFAYILFEGYSSRENAENLRNFELLVKKEDFEIKNEDTFLIGDVIGCNIYNLQNQLLGEIIQIEQYGSADVWYYRGNGRTHSFPYISDIVKQVDIKQKRVVVDEEKLNEAKI
jgi:16S rRNA processing protein RimM